MRTIKNDLKKKKKKIQVITAMEQAYIPAAAVDVLFCVLGD